MFDDLYCKIYLDTSLSKENLLQHIANFVKGDVFLRTVENNLMGIAVVVNEDCDSKLKLKKGGFIYYPYYLEIDPTDAGEENHHIYITSISELLKFLWRICTDAIPACDYEQQLPSREKKVA